MQVLSDADLVCEFESLGDNCEFGTIQRDCGREPLGLFRFNSSYIDNIVDVLETRCAHLFTQDDIEIYEEPSTNEYMCRSKRYGDFSYHTFVEPSRITADKQKAREVRKIEYLKTRLLEDAAGAAKIFVRKGGEPLAKLRRLHRALSLLGPNVLLIVVTADAAHPPGHVELIGDRLLRGYVRNFKVFSRYDPADLTGWLDVCRNAHRLVRPGFSYARSTLLRGASSWSWGEICKRGAADGLPASPRSRTARHLTFVRDTGPAEVVASVSLPRPNIDATAVLLFSAWVWIPASFAGYRVDACWQDATVLHSHPADLSRRDCWQQIWATARLPEDVDAMVCTIRSGAANNADFYLADWTFEIGCVPTPPPPTFRERLPSAARAARRFGTDLRRALARALAAAADRVEPYDLAALMRRHEAQLRLPADFHRLASGLIERQAFVEADDVLSRALIVFPREPSLSKLYALSAHNSARYATAIDRWLEAIDITPQDPMCFAGLAANFREHRNLARADEVITTALSRFAEDTDVVSEGARIAEAQECPARALDLWTRAIGLRGEHAEWVAGRDRASASLARSQG